ncbi:hypothetical protein GCM10022377_14540 [Zhihengliuella alba]|uniref:DUF2569 domain-containing protein n=1 Tax=Zhihengliuella alba TaxID=547018 RepID=A0ABP7D7K6_9MICC
MAEAHETSMPPQPGQAEQAEQAEVAEQSEPAEQSEQSAGSAVREGPGDGATAEPHQFVLLKRIAILSGALYAASHLIGLPATVYTGLVMTGADPFTALAPAPDVQAMAIAGAVTGLLVVLAVYVAVVIGLFRRRNWARTLGLVCAIASIILTAQGLLSVPAAPATDGLGSLTLILDLVAVPVNAYWVVLALGRPVSGHLHRPRSAPA